MKAVELKFDQNGLIPAVVQDASTLEVLTVAYMNEEALAKSLETEETWFYSRSRKELWHKGETSGNTQKIVEMKYDCDGDALVVLVDRAGPACHTGSVSCFTENLLEPENADRGSSLSDFQVVLDLEKIIRQREQERPEGAYTTYLFEKGIDKMLKKVGEEAAEVIIAAKNRDSEELKWEAADLWFHLMVLLQEQKVPLKDVLGTLNKRNSSKGQ